MRLRMVKWPFVMAVIGLALLVGRLPHTLVGAQEVRLGKPIPYTVILRETVHSPNGTATVAMDEIFAIRSDGSYVGIHRHKKQTGDKLVDSDSRREIYLASGVRVEINEFTGAKSTTASKINPAIFQRDPSTRCLNSFDGTSPDPKQEIRGEEMVAGYRSVKIASNNMTYWYALDHGCAMVKFRADWSAQEYSEKSLIALTPGEPEAGLFEAPPDENEMSPSEMILGRGKDISSCGSPGCAETLRRLDEQYKANRPKK